MNGRSVAMRGGLATVGVLGALAAAHALRRIGARVLWPAERDEYRDEDFALLDDDPAGIVIASDGVTLATRTVGPDDAEVTVVFVHGFCNAMEAFHFQRRDLADRWGDSVRMVFFDQRGHGRSGAPTPESCTVGQLGRDLVSVIEATAPTGPVVLVAHSLGGMGLLAAAAQSPEFFASRVAGVALICTAAAEVAGTGIAQVLSHPVIDGFRLAVRSAPALVRFGRRASKHVVTPILHVSSFHGPVSPTLSRFTTMMIDRTPVETIEAFLEAIRLHDESAALPVLAELPVLVLGGAHDMVIPFVNSRVLAQRLPSAELVRVADAAHMPQLQFADEVTDALDRLLVRAGVGADAGNEAVGG
ncbi:alpha/beta fold hydrolase [Nocardia camponoti]|uniref:Alpha/beta hydrolase n=1 Tax=Nocardia camponoti TaxID=1616106 RepID=A0A917QMK6_9NOCA|nr:alpha/beta hydrolase [Nocardia camponoti]GGK56959.1 alpha/beta hydrolase [Nocardia camponoti]